MSNNKFLLYHVLAYLGFSFEGKLKYSRILRLKTKNYNTTKIFKINSISE